MKTFYLLLFLCLILLQSCSKKEKISIDDSCFRSNVVFINSTNYDSSNFLSRGYFFSEYLDNRMSEVYSKFCMYSDDSVKNRFYNSDIEIEYISAYITEPFIENHLEIFPIKTFICIKKINEKFKAFFIISKNLPYQKIQNKLYINSEIGCFTDTIITNLNLDLIQKFYPKFKGNYVNKKVDTILIDDSYLVTDKDFYNFIRFDNERLGIPIKYNGIHGIFRF